MFGIADIVVLVRRRSLHGLRYGSHVFDSVVAHRAQIEVFEDVEHFEHHDSPTGWAVRRHSEPPISRLKWFIVSGSVVGEISVV